MPVIDHRAAVAEFENATNLLSIRKLTDTSDDRHVFISYKQEDLDFAENVIGRLAREGLPTWVDSKIRAGEEWRTTIDIAIENAAALVVIMTPEAKASEYVTYEWAFALGKGIRVIPVMLKPTSLHPRLEALQYIDFTNIKSRPWDRLIEELRASYASDRRAQ